MCSSSLQTLAEYYKYHWATASCQQSLLTGGLFLKADIITVVWRQGKANSLFISRRLVQGACVWLSLWTKMSFFTFSSWKVPFNPVQTIQRCWWMLSWPYTDTHTSSCCCFPFHSHFLLQVREAWAQKAFGQNNPSMESITESPSINICPPLFLLSSLSLLMFSPHLRSEGSLN